MDAEYSQKPVVKSETIDVFILDWSESTINFKLRGLDLATANALRRAMIAEVPIVGSV
jgi:DNA-directed RNA polymerase alpha subunit